MIVRINLEDPRNIIQKIESVKREIVGLEAKIADLQKKIEENGFIFRRLISTPRDYYQANYSPYSSVDDLNKVLEDLSSYKEDLFLYERELSFAWDVIEAFNRETNPPQLVKLCKKDKILSFLNRVFLSAGFEFYRKSGHEPNDWQMGVMMMKILIRLREKGIESLFESFSINYVFSLIREDEKRLKDSDFINSLKLLFEIASGKREDSGETSKETSGNALNIPPFDQNRLIRAIIEALSGEGESSSGNSQNSKNVGEQESNSENQNNVGNQNSENQKEGD